MDWIVIMVLGIVFLGTATGTIHKYMDYRVQLAERLGRGGDRSVLKAIEELRAEIAALRRHESDAVLSFDSTLQALDARMTRLEQRSVEGSGAERPSLSPTEAQLPAVTQPERSDTSQMAAGQLSRSG